LAWDVGSVARPHASDDELSQLLALWQERSGRLYFFPATP
jgi:hypothetical protein